LTLPIPSAEREGIAVTTFEVAQALALSSVSLMTV
jgi:hypothetical protein